MLRAAKADKQLTQCATLEAGEGWLRPPFDPPDLYYAGARWVSDLLRFRSGLLVVAQQPSDQNHSGRSD